MLLSSNLILVKGIIAKFLNRTLAQPMSHVGAIIEESVDLGVPKNFTLLGDAGEGEIITAMHQTLSWLDEVDSKTVIKREDILSTVKMNVGFESQYVDAVLDAIPSDIDQKDEDERKRIIGVVLSELKFYIKKKKMLKRLKDAQRDLTTENSSDGANSIVNILTEELKSETTDLDGKPAGFVGEFNSEDEKSVEDVFESTKSMNTDEGTLRLPLKALGRGIGNIWFRRGDMVCVKARSNNYKSGGLLDITKWLPAYNKPLLKDENKKPLILRISFENTPEQDALTLYKSIMEHKLKKKIHPASIDPSKAAKEMVKYFSQNGYRVAIVCFDPNKFDVWKLIEVINYYESSGYELHAVVCDYLEVIAKATRNQRPDTAITSAFEIVRNNCMPKRITFFTAHQLNTASGEVLNEVGSAAFPRKVAQSGGLYDHNCRSLIQKLDIEIVLHIHLQGEEKYLGWGIGKLREREACEKHKYFWYKFQKYGGIVPEEGDDDLAIYSLSTMTTSSEADTSGAAW